MGDVVRLGRKRPGRAGRGHHRRHRGRGQAGIRLRQDDHRLRSRDAGTHRAHSDARGAEQQAETKRTLGFPDDKFFYVPDAAAERYREIARAGAGLQTEWEAAVDTLPDAAELRRVYAGEIPALELADFLPDEGPIATRAASGKVLAQLAGQVPQLIGGSADLTPSNNTHPPDWSDFQPATPEGRYLRFGCASTA